MVDPLTATRRNATYLLLLVRYYIEPLEINQVKSSLARRFAAGELVRFYATFWGMGPLGPAWPLKGGPWGPLGRWAAIRMCR